MNIRRGNHGPLNKTTRSSYVFSVPSDTLTMDYLYNMIRVKVEEAISDADKTSSDYKYYDIRKTKILASLKKPIKDNPFLETFTDSMLRSTCSVLLIFYSTLDMIRQRRKSQTIILDISVYTNPLLKKDSSVTQDNTKDDQTIADSNLVVIACLNS